MKVQKVLRETPTTNSIFFRDKLCLKAKPGQFVMVWAPGVDEVPMSLSRINLMGGFSSITVKKVGEATETLHNLKKNLQFGVRGPYGKGFKIVDAEVLLVGGGVGVSSLLPLARGFKSSKKRLTMVVGAKSVEELLFIKEFKKILGRKDELVITTEDGSMGVKGLITDVLPELLTGKSYKQVYACGSELMLKKVLDLTLEHKVPAQLSLERYIKCGVGLCGSCVVDGFRVCRDGPVFSSKTLCKIKEFGFSRRDPCGRKVPV